MPAVRYRMVTRRRRYRINGRRFYPLLALFIIFVILAILNKVQQKGLYANYSLAEVDPQHLEMYFDVEAAQGVPWYYLMAIDKAEDISAEEISPGRGEQLALHLRGITSPKELGEKLKEYNNDPNFIKRVEYEIKRLQYINEVYEDKVFPVAQVDYTYSNDFGNSRTYGGDRHHEGIDIMCEMGTPLLAVCDGVVEKKGWLELGGWRIGIRGDDGIYYYYAHLSRYEDGLEEGDRVKKGQVIGYAGDSGYGEEGTTGQFAPHLHFGMYERDSWSSAGEKAINPYPFLKAWERRSGQAN
ncbi:MAG: M23 family metallopeptidase [Clostridiales bacterium]|nr:M23 family metallopeptidase [Clostridiales bacterium]